MAHPGQMFVQPNCSKLVLRNGARRTCQNSHRNCFVWLQYRCSSQLYRHHLPVHLVSILCRVLCPACCWSIVASWQSFECSGFHHSTCGTNKYRVPSIHWSQVPCSNLEFRWPRQRLDDFKVCQEGEQRAFPHFVHMLSCCLDPPQTDSACWLHTAQSTSTDATLEADSTANFIDLTCSLTTVTRWIAGHFQRMFLAQHHQSKPASPS